VTGALRPVCGWRYAGRAAAPARCAWRTTTLRTGSTRRGSISALRISRGGVVSAGTVRRGRHRDVPGRRRLPL